MFGILNIYKPQGITSFDVIARLRKKLNIKQIGHSGTLDPMAEGVLCVCVGKATRIIEFLPSDKTYIATAKLGLRTNTYDIEGEILSQTSPNINIEQIQTILGTFSGEIEQKPPIFSAIKIKGKKLYEYARKNEEIEIPTRKVKIYDIKIINYENNDLTFEVSCSSGTYIRSIINDLGEILGCGACMTKLIRTKANNLSVENAQNLDKITKDTACFIDVTKILELPKIVLSATEAQKIEQGQFICKNIQDDKTISLIFDNKLKAIGYSKNNQIKPKKVF